VLAVCDDLVAGGWLDEVADSRAAGLTVKGRPARRYRLRGDAGFVTAVDAGEHRIAAAVADLRGRILAERSAPGETVGDRRRGAVTAVFGEALSAAGLDVSDVLLAVVGVPAPVGADGRSPVGERGYWADMNPGFDDLLPDGAVVVENDANLAAIAEQVHNPGAPPANVVTVLSGERLGAGVIVDGRLLRGARGGVGEMRFLSVVEGAGTADGIAALARTWATDAVAAGATTVLGADAAAEDVLAAAAAGDAVAAGIVERLGERVARFSAVLESILDVERVVIAGAIADAVEPVLAHARTVLDRDFQPPAPEVVASTLGAEVVVLGGVQAALARIREHPLAFTPRARPA